MNNVNLVGRLSRDPETRNGNTTVTTIFVATDRPKLRDGKTYKDESGYTAKETEFHIGVVGGGLLLGLGVGALGGTYGSTDIGKITSLAVLDAFRKLIVDVQARLPAKPAAATAPPIESPKP